MNANLESLAAIHGKEKAAEVMREIADLGGYGNPGPAAIAGGLDLAGALAESNTEIPTKAKERIAELTHVNRKDADAIVQEGKGTSSASKMKSTKQEGK